jgi:serine/threonine protein phosphatase 1
VSDRNGAAPGVSPVETLRFDRPVAVLGDIHGRADLLARMFAALPADMPVLVAGDVCDRGPGTRGVLDLLVARSAQGVLGNHDLWLRDWANGRGFDSFALHPHMGGDATLRSYGVVGRSPGAVESEAWRVPDAHRRWLDARPVAIDLEVAGTKWWIVHAGIPTTVDLSGVTAAQVVPALAARHPASLLWAKNDPDEMLPVDRPVVMGHIVLTEPIDHPHVIAVDTGCGSRQLGYLTAVILPERRFVRVG